MKTIEEIKQHYEVDLKDEIDDFESRRKELYKNISEVFKNRKVFEGLTNEYKQVVLQKLLHFTSPSMQQDLQSGWEAHDFKDSMFFPDVTYNSFKSNSLNVFSTNNLELKTAFVLHTSSDEGSISDDFRGMYSRIDLAGAVPVNTVIKPNHRLVSSEVHLFGKMLGGWIDKLGAVLYKQSNKNLVTLGDSEFDHYFEVHSISLDSARNLLPEHLRKRMIASAKQTKNRSYFSFTGRHFNMYIGDYYLFKWRYEHVNQPLNSYDNINGYFLALFEFVRVAASFSQDNK